MNQEARCDSCNAQCKAMDTKKRRNSPRCYTRQVLRQGQVVSCPIVAIQKHRLKKQQHDSCNAQCKAMNTKNPGKVKKLTQMLY